MTNSTASDDSLGADVRLTTRETAFVENLVRGLGTSRAWQAATGNPNRDSCRVAGFMALRRPHVRRALRELQAMRMAKAQLDRESLARWLEDGILADPAVIARAVSIDDVPLTIRRHVVKLTQRIGADGSLTTICEFSNRAKLAEQLAKLEGWNKPDRLELTGDAALPARDDREFMDGLDDRELAEWGHATRTGNRAEAERLRALGIERLRSAVLALRDDRT